jgi:hypothetical protein
MLGIGAAEETAISHVAAERVRKHLYLSTSSAASYDLMLFFRWKLAHVQAQLCNKQRKARSWY